jgi:hypothetical protein
MKVKTRNWGTEFRDVSRLVGLKSHAVRANEQSLKSEVANHSGHAYGRHGAQTGWEAQFIRAVTQITPDQAFDPMGLNPTTRRWNSVMSMSDYDGSAVFDLFQDHGGDPQQYATAAGTTAGGFLTPEAQYLAKSRGEAMLGQLSGPSHYCAQYRFKAENRFIRAPINSVHVVVGSPDKGAPYGLGFERRDPKSYPRFSRDFVVKCIDAMQTGKTWAQIVPPGQVNATTYKFNVITLGRNKVAFPSMDELCDFFELNVLWQSTASLIFRRNHIPATHSHGPWRSITMFPNGIEAGWAPSLFLTDEAKNALRGAGFNRNADDYHWTGLVTSMDGRQKQRYPVPAWGA